ncbi:unnamed protein product [Closterium sp. NIES-53]
MWSHLLRNSRRSSRSYSSRSSNHSNSWCSRRESRSSGKHLSSDHDSTSSRSSGNIRRHSRNRWSSRSLHALISRLLALPIFISTHCLHGKHLDGRTRLPRHRFLPAARDVRRVNTPRFLAVPGVHRTAGSSLAGATGTVG